MKVYDVVKQVLELYPETRNSDKKLIWCVWAYELKTNGVYNILDKESPNIDSYGMNKLNSYMYYECCTSPESITRARRKVQELNPELQATEPVKQARDIKESKKGNFVFHEDMP